MYKRSIIHFKMRCDLLVKEVTYGQSGQPIASWKPLAERQRCMYSPDRTNTRIEPTQEEADRGFITLPYDSLIDYDVRVVNITNRYEEVIAPGPFEVLEIRPFTSYTGRVNQIQAKVKRVIER